MSQTPRPWTDEEIAYLSKNYYLVPIASISEHLDRDNQSVRSKVYRLGITRKVAQNHSGWSPSDIARLRELYSETPWSQLCKELNRGEMSIRAKATKLGLTRISTNHLWREDEIKFVHDNMDSMSIYKIADHLGRSVSSTSSKIHHLRNPKPIVHKNNTTRRRHWTDAEVDDLKRLYPTTPTRELAERFDRSTQAIISKAQDLGIKAVMHYHRPESHADPINSPYLRVSEPNKSYTAALIDGEGHIEFKDRHRESGKKLWIEVGMTHYDTIKYLHDTWGGSIYDKKVPAGRKQMWVWRLLSPIDSRHLLVAIYPYLITKKDLAAEAINYVNSYSPP